jgi:hypothetical protein
MSGKRVELLVGIAGDCTVILRLFDEHDQTFRSSLDESQIPRPFAPGAISGLYDDKVMLDWLELSLQFGRTGMFQWMVESKPTDPELARTCQTWPFHGQPRVRGPTGDSLLSVALSTGNITLSDRIRKNPKFDFAEQELGQCIATAVRHRK